MRWIASLAAQSTVIEQACMAVKSTGRKKNRTRSRQREAAWIRRFGLLHLELSVAAEDAEMVAVAGKVLSGVAVAKTIKSISEASTPPCFRAALAALTAKSEVSSFFAAILRSDIPVRCWIHSSEVSRVSDNS